jgi:hypothetical protein
MRWFRLKYTVIIVDCCSRTLADQHCVETTVSQKGNTAVISTPHLIPPMVGHKST